MSTPRQLPAKSVLFIGGESSNTYHHTSGLVTLEPTEGREFSVESVRNFLADRLGQVPHFRWRLHEVPLGLDLPYWVDDENFSFDNHIRRIAVPAPGDRVALGELVSYLYSRHLDRSRPLWEVWIIEGLAEGRLALFSKLHHSLMDGQGAEQLGVMINDLEPDAAPRSVDPVIAEALPGPIPSLLHESVTTARHLGGLPLRAAGEVVDLARTTIRKRIRREADRPDQPAPPTMFNGGIGPARGFVFGSVSLDAVKAVKDHFDVTVNDVLLAVVGGSLRRYLIELDELPADPLRTSIAVSLRQEGDDPFSNQVTDAAVTLASDLDDPVERLMAISADSQVAKENVRQGGRGMLDTLSIFPPVLVGALTTGVSADVVRSVSGINLIISNVRGSPFPLYLGGAKTTAMYPMSIVMKGSGPNVTCISYLDNVDVGITIDPSIFPEPWRLIDGLDIALAELSSRLPKKARRTRRSRG